MQIIKLTSAIDEKDIYVNVYSITSFRMHLKEDKTVLYYTSGSCDTVKETPDEVISKMGDKS